MDGILVDDARIDFRTPKRERSDVCVPWIFLGDGGRSQIGGKRQVR